MSAVTANSLMIIIIIIKIIIIIIVIIIMIIIVMIIIIIIHSYLHLVPELTAQLTYEYAILGLC